MSSMLGTGHSFQVIAGCEELAGSGLQAFWVCVPYLCCLAGAGFLDGGEPWLTVGSGRSAACSFSVSVT